MKKPFEKQLAEWRALQAAQNPPKEGVKDGTAEEALPTPPAEQDADSARLADRMNREPPDPERMAADIASLVQANATLAIRLSNLEARARQSKIKELLEEKEEEEEDLGEAAMDYTQSVDTALENLTGTGYNLGPRRKPGGGWDIFGRYNGPFYCELVSDTAGTITNPSGAPRTVQRLRVHSGKVNAGKSVWHWPRNDESIGYADLILPTGGISGGISAQPLYPYIEVAAYPKATSCDQLWDVVGDAKRYSPILRWHQGTYPTQAYSKDDWTQTGDWEFIRNSPFGATEKNPRQLEAAEDIWVAKFILGKVELKALGGSGIPEDPQNAIVKWTPYWHASDIYCPVWEYTHCTEADGIIAYPDTSSLECIYAASLCAPICITPFDIFVDHYHMPQGGGVWMDNGGDQTTYPFGGCGLDGSGQQGV